MRSEESDLIRSRLTLLKPLADGVQPTRFGLESRQELLLGCGPNKGKQMALGEQAPEWTGLVTLDCDADSEPDVVHDMNVMPYPFPDEAFDEVHAYNVLEHLGSLGDSDFFFLNWNELGRITKLGGLFFGIVPDLKSRWLFGDPGHARVITLDMLQFLDKDYYFCGKTQSDSYFKMLQVSWKLTYARRDDEHLYFVLQKEALS